MDKLYYSISEVADILEVETHVLRYWESEFAQLRPKKNKAFCHSPTMRTFATEHNTDRSIKQ